MKQRFVCLLLTLALAVPLAASAAEKPAGPGDGWSDAFRSFVLEGGYRRSGQSWYDRTPSFALHDMDGNGVPELLAGNNAPQAADRTAYVYTFTQSGVAYAGSAGRLGPADHFLPGSGCPGLYCLSGGEEALTGTYSTLSGGKVTEELVLTIAAAPDVCLVTQETKDDALFDAFRPADAAQVLLPPGEALAYAPPEQIRTMGWEDFVARSLAADNTRFADVSLGHWAWAYTDYVCGRGLMTGTGQGIFSPAGVINRAQVATILYRLEGSPLLRGGRNMADVPADAWYADAARWAVGIGIADAEGTFQPDRTMERQELAQILYRYAQYKGHRTPAAVAIFPDWDQVREDCVEAMYWAVGAGLITGTGDGRLDPTGSLTRAQLAAMLQRFCENVLSK